MSLFTAVVFITTLFGCLASTPQNVARGKTAVQSSTYAGQNNLLPNNSVDGDISSDNSKLAHTNNSIGSNWWRVDLGRRYKIGKVIIFSRTDAGTTRDMSKVYILTANEGSSSSPSPNNTNWDIVYYIEPVLSEREEITLYLTTPYQHLAVYREKGNIITSEVEVYNWTGAENPQTLTQTASQSSTFYNGTEAAIAIDGLMDMTEAFGTYSSTNRTVPHWWRVSLKESCTKCYVRLYPYLRPLRFGDGFSRLASITVLSSSLDSPTAPNSDQWNSCYHFTEAQNGPIIGSCNDQNITHVAVYRNTEQALELVEVEVFHSVEDAFSSTSLTAESSSCVKMTWSIKPNHFISYFKFSCTGKSAQNISSTVSEYTQCGYLPYDEAVCEIEAIGFGSKVVEQKTRTPCEAPAKPTGIVVRQLNQQNSNDDLPVNRIKFNVTWTASKPNCAKVEYSVKLEGPSPGSKPAGPSNTQNFGRRIAGAEYTVTVTAINKPDNQISLSDPYIFTANSRAPEFSNSGATVTATSSDCVKVDWKTPEYENGAVTKYRYNCNSRDWTPVDSNVKSNDSVCGFGPYKDVTCEVQAANNADIWSSSVRNSTKTFCAAPTVADFTLSDKKTMVDGRERRQITVIIPSGGKPNCESANLTVKLLKENGDLVTDQIATGLSGRPKFNDLDAVMRYQVKVSAKNNVGNESRTVEKSHKTGEVAPYTEPDQFTATPSDSCVTLRWEKPSQPNGDIISYTYTCDVWNGTRRNTSNAVVTTATVCDLKSATRVNCSITAKNSEGVSPAATLTVFTLFKYNVPPVEAKLSENQIEGQINVVVSLPEFQNANTEISYYQFIVEKVGNAANSRRKRSSSTTSVAELDLLFNYTIAESMNLSYYVAGQLSPSAGSDTIGFDYGDGEISGGFDNRRLEAGVSYKTHYKFIVKSGDTESPQFIRGKKAFVAYVKPPPPPQNNTIPIIVGSVIAVVVAASVIIVITVLYIRKRKNSRKDEESKRTVTSVYGESTNDRTVPRSKPAMAVKPMVQLPDPPTENSELEVYADEYVNMPLLPKCGIDADRRSLQAYINNSKETIVLQYKEIGSLPKVEMSRASDPDTKGKNRYKGLYPGDSHRVKLIDNPDDCDYINASYLDGYNQPNKFIAAMGPLANTVADFWLMIWENDVRTVVMVTRLIEECKEKCSQYWPELRQQTVYGEITVRLVAEDGWADYQVRNLHVSKGEEIRHVVQYHYLSWPDHGVPKYTGPFVSFYRKISKDVNDRIDNNQTAPGPCVVHCSAGVGRTGTFIALDYLLDQAKEEGELKVFECVKSMRKRRPAMVQKEEQYFFLHAALLEAITSADVSTNKATMKEKMDEFEQSRGGKILGEFNIICEESTKVIHDFSSGEDPDNLSYNLTQDILPDDHCRPFLLDSDTAYINAVLINGTHVENQYICTQSPLPSTLDHFWAMIFDQGFSTLIITQPNQLNILPSDKFTAGKYRVTKKKVWLDEFPTTELYIDYKKKPTLKVTLFDMSEIWSDDKFIECHYVITLYETVKRWLQQNKNPKVTVVCRDGATRCGLIINAFNCLEKLELEQQCDVYSSVLMSKIRRSELISTVDEYLYIYQVLKEFADGYNAYANFD